MKPAVSISLPDGRHYPIFISSGILEDQSFWNETLAGRTAVIVTNTTVAPLYAKNLAQLISNKNDVITIPDGEEHKSLGTYEHVLTELLNRKLDRSSVLIALGGGVVGDLAGFAAATFHRGISYIQVPTTLLSQVDSSVGGKTAVNHPLGKNLIGAFYQPMSVVIDTTTLRTLPRNVFTEGLAEVIKYGVIADPEFFAWLEDNREAVLGQDPQALKFIIRRSCELKAEVVAEDERETGRRAILNFGHTFGHALETEFGYGALFHGEAVSIGMKLAAEMSLKLGLTDPTTVNRVKNLLQNYGLPISIQNADAQKIRTAMNRDKKAVQGRLKFVLLRTIGQVEVRDDVAEDVLAQTLAEISSV